MALYPCYECGQMISGAAEECRHCGAPVTLSGSRSLPGATIVWALLAFLAGSGGLFVAFGEPDKILGGDAYNYIVAGLRGATLVGAGIILGLFAVCAAAATDRRRRPPPKEPTP